MQLQGSFGPSASSLEQGQQQSLSEWVDQQLNMGSAYDSSTDGWLTHLERTIEIAEQAEPSIDWHENGVFNQRPASGNVDDYQMAAWWDNALGSKARGREQIGSDQLRQRVAYALSQILVVSASNPLLAQRGESLAHYYDTLAKHAFGNYRDLLGDVARSPAMGIFLSHQGNRKADATSNTRPDENFARELMQLFTIGLYQLNNDGSPNRDSNATSFPDSGNELLPSYTPNDVEELAKVMTGWDLQANNSYGRSGSRDGDYTVPMEFTPEEHEDEVEEGGDGSVNLLGESFALDSGSDGSGLDAALDVLFNHPNTPAFVSSLLIKRLTASNPSPDYIARVASSFIDNGRGERGDLKAVIRAILLDQEARSEAENAGKLKEPLLAFTQLLRSTNATPVEGWKSREDVPMHAVYWYKRPQSHFGQAPLRSPSVFNFYSPDHIPSDPRFSEQDLTAPEAKIMTDQLLMEYGNRIYHFLHTNEVSKITVRDENTLEDFAESKHQGNDALILTDFRPQLEMMEMIIDGDSNGDFVNLENTETDADGNTAKARAIDSLLDHINTVMLGGNMDAGYRAALRHYLLEASGVQSSDSAEEVRLIVRDAFHLLATSGSYLKQG